MMSIPKPGSLIFLQDYQTTQQNGSTNYCPGTGSCNTNPKQRQHNAPSEKLEPFTWGEKRMDTSLSGLSHADVARSRRRRVISAVEPDEPASNFQQRDDAVLRAALEERHSFGSGRIVRRLRPGGLYGSNRRAHLFLSKGFSLDLPSLYCP